MALTLTITLNPPSVVTKCIEAIMQFEYFDETRLVKQYFYHLSAGARRLPADAAWGQAEISEAQLDAAEERFLDQLVRLLLLARYRPLSRAEWRVSGAACACWEL